MLQLLSPPVPCLVLMDVVTNIVCVKDVVMTAAVVDVDVDVRRSGPRDMCELFKLH